MTTDGFIPLPHSMNRSGQHRLCGVEIEFAGLTERETADLIREHLGGEVSDDGPHSLRVKDTSLGDIKVVLDTSVRKISDNAVLQAGLDALRGLIPVEIVTEPLTRTQLQKLDLLRNTLRGAGALGTRDGVLLGFGVHLNVAVVAPDDPFTRRTILAFALVEHWLRDMAPINATRRVMPFVQPWPEAFVADLAQRAPEPPFDDIRQLYVRHCNNRNHALDLLPLFKHADEQGFQDLFPDQTNTKGRPAYHFRLPDCRIDEPAWSLDREWRRWWLVEQLAADPQALSELAADYAVLDTGDWVEVVRAHLGEDGNKLGAVYSAESSGT